MHTQPKDIPNSSCSCRVLLHPCYFWFGPSHVSTCSWPFILILTGSARLDEIRKILVRKYPKGVLARLAW